MLLRYHDLTGEDLWGGWGRFHVCGKFSFGHNEEPSSSVAAAESLSTGVVEFSFALLALLFGEMASL